MTFRPYISVFVARFQLMLQYRAAAVAGFITQTWFGVIRIMVFAAFFAGAAHAQPMSLANAVTYTWLGQAFLIFLPWSGDADIAEMVRSGSVAYERLRPVDTYAWWYVRLLAATMAGVLPRAALMILLAGVILPLSGLGQWGLAPPPTLAAAALFGASFVGMVLLSAAMRSLINIITVAAMNDRGANTLAAPFVNVFSGMVVPLAFVPAWAQGFLRAQPFAGLVDIPFSIYFGGLKGGEALIAIALQFGWTAALILGGRAWLGRVMTRLQVQGG
jgi:ABC-2 type transport system permease protein